MTDKPISPLRQRMIEDMTARHFAEKAQTDYIRYVKNFAAFLGRSPDTACAEDLRLFQLHMAKTHVSPWTINATVVALRFFFKVTLERDDLVRRLTLVSEPRRAPIVLSPEEVARLLTAAPGVKYRAALGDRRRDESAGAAQFEPGQDPGGKPRRAGSARLTPASCGSSRPGGRGYLPWPWPGLA